MDRKKKIIEILTKSDAPVSASSIAEALGVSRQIIVGDVALLRASGEKISATPRGYIYQKNDIPPRFGYDGIIACKHTAEQVREELYTIVDFGGYAIDVIIEHSLYGQLSGCLDIASRYEVDLFCEQIKKENNRPLSLLTGGVHLHHIGCRDKATFELIKNKLTEKGIALE